MNQILDDLFHLNTGTFRPHVAGVLNIPRHLLDVEQISQIFEEKDGLELLVVWHRGRTGLYYYTLIMRPDTFIDFMDARLTWMLPIEESPPISYLSTDFSVARMTTAALVV